MLLAIGGGKDKDQDKDAFRKKLNIRVGNLKIVDTTPTSMLFEVNVNLTNPTNYSASIPYFSINILVNDTTMGQALVKNMHVRPGNNTNLVAQALWAPYDNSGVKGKHIGAEMLSQYISGFNTSITLQAHNGTVPAQPALGNLLSRYPYTIPAPHLSHPKDPNNGDDGDDDGGESKKEHFIQSATMHLISSTASFVLSSPFQHTTM